MRTTAISITPVKKYYNYTLKLHLDLLVALNACSFLEDDFHLPTDFDQLRLINIKRYFESGQNHETLRNAIVGYCNAVSSITPYIKLDQVEMGPYQSVKDQKPLEDFDDEEKMFAFLSETISILAGNLSYYEANLGVVNGHRDLENQKSALNFNGIYKRDPRFSWPINQIGSLPIYAAKGPVDTSKILSNNSHPIDFFLEISGFLRLRSQQKGEDNGLDIKTIIALGSSDDFVDYFQSGADKTFSFLLDGHETRRVTIQTLSSKIHNDTFFIREHQIKIIVSDVNKNIANPVHEKNLTVINVRMPDGTAVKYTNLALHHQLIQSLKKGEGILVHCKAGLGRTGQMIAQLLAIAEGKAETFFTPDGQYNIEAISAFVAYLRTYRPGLILETDQLLAFLMNVKQLHLSLANNDPLQKSAHQTLGIFTPEVKKSDKSEKEEQPTKKKKLA